MASLAFSFGAISQELLSDEDIQKAYEAAAKSYQQDHPAKPIYVAPTAEPLLTKPNMLNDSQDVAMISKEAEVFHYSHDAADYLPLEGIRIAVDVENRSLKEVVNEIVTYAENKSGPWKVKWRLRPENKHILDSRVNLTAETTFEEFMNHLIDRINNMTGVQLGVNVFDMSRIIVISDSY
jgi:hypothetical protein